MECRAIEMTNVEENLVKKWDRCERRHHHERSCPVVSERGAEVQRGVMVRGR